MATFERLPSGKWRARIDVRGPDGNRKRVSRTADTKRELRQLVADVELNGAPTSSTMTVGELVELWLAGPARRTTVESTLIGYASKWRALLEPLVGHLRLDELTAGHLDAAYSELVADGRSPAYVGRAHVVINRALEQARRWGAVRHAVSHDASPPGAGRTVVDPPTPTEVRRLLACAAGDDMAEARPWWPAFVRLAAATGARRGELLAARWEDFADDGRRWRISRGITSARGGDVVGAGKSGAAVRTIAVDGRTAAELDAWRSIFGVPRRAGWCWPGADEARPLGRSAVEGAWSATLELADLGRRVRFHDLRHAHATTLLSEGVDVRTVAGRLGHSDPSIVLRVYAAWMPARDEAAAGRIGELLAD